MRKTDAVKGNSVHFSVRFTGAGIPQGWNVDVRPFFSIKSSLSKMIRRD